MPGEYVENLIVSAGPISIGSKVIASPFQFYLDGNDNIRVEGWCSKADVSLQVFGRALNDQGEIEVFQMVVLQDNNGLRVVRDFSLARGFLLNLVVATVGAVPLLGQAFARISVIRGLTGATIVLGTMLQGYVTDRQVLAWPGSPLQTSDAIDGYIRTFGYTLVPLGSPFDVTVGVAFHWKLLSARAVLATDATVVTRRPYLFVGQNIPGYPVFHLQTLAASSSQPFFWAAGLTGNLDTTQVPGTVALGTWTELDGGGNFYINASGLQPGDQFTEATLVVRERLAVV